MQDIFERGKGELLRQLAMYAEEGDRATSNNTVHLQYFFVTWVVKFIYVWRFHLVGQLATSYNTRKEN